MSNFGRAESPSAPAWTRVTLACVLLYFPVCGLVMLPMGGSGRYLSALSGPLALVFLLAWHRREWRDMGDAARSFALPFLPWFIASLVVVAVYSHAAIGDPFSRVLWALAIALAAMRTGVSREGIFNAAAIGASVYFLVAAHEYFIVGNERVGSATNPIIFAETAMLTSGLALMGAYTVSSAAPALRVLWLALGCAGLGAVALSYSRGPMLALLVLALLFGVDRSRRKSKLAVSLVSIGTIILLATLFYWTPLGDRALLAWTEANAYITTNANESSTGIRLEIWRIALVAIGEQPLLGYGYSNILELSAQVPALKFLPPEMLKGLQHFHSDWVHALMAGGVILAMGLAATVAGLVWHARHDLARLWLVGAMLAFGLTDLAFFRKPTVTLFIAAWALLFATHSRSEHANEAHSVHR